MQQLRVSEILLIIGMHQSIKIGLISMSLCRIPVKGNILILLILNGGQWSNFGLVLIFTFKAIRQRLLYAQACK